MPAVVPLPQVLFDEANSANAALVAAAEVALEEVVAAGRKEPKRNRNRNRKKDEDSDSDGEWGGGSGDDDSGAQSDNGSSDGPDREWIQCEKCKKWRKVPVGLCAEALLNGLDAKGPFLMTCQRVFWDPDHSWCGAPQQETPANPEDDWEYYDDEQEYGGKRK